ncbi:MAG TPA: recombinase family protein [Clostridia bacterium]
MDKIKVCAYCRVSTNSKDQTNSFENQKNYFQNVLSTNPEYELVEIYADKGLSGTKLNRPEFDRMLNDAGLDIIEVKNKDKDNRKDKIKYVTIPSTSRKPKFNRIFVTNTSRFARNILVEEILRDLRKNKVYVNFIDLGKTTENEDDITYIQIFQTFDERESRDKSKKVLFGIKEGYNKNIIHTNSKLFGYNFIQKENRLEIVEQEAEIIRKIFEIYSQGKGIRQIRNILMSEGLKSRDGKNFGNTTIRRILHNEKYCGLDNRGKFDTGIILDSKHYPKPREEYKTKINEKIPGIVSIDLFNSCKKIMEGKINYQNQKGIYKKLTKYTGLIYCTKCKSAYTSNVDRGKAFYNCSTKKKYGTKACDNVNLYVIDLEKVLSYLCESGYNEHFAENRAWYISELEKEIFELKEDINKDNKIKVEELQQNKKDYENRIENLQNELVGINKPVDVILSAIQKISEKVKEIESEIGYYSMTNNEIYNKINDVQQTIDNLYKVELKTTYTIEEMLNFISKIEVRKGTQKNLIDPINRPVLNVFFNDIISLTIAPDNVS